MENFSLKPQISTSYDDRSSTKPPLNPYGNTQTSEISKRVESIVQ